MSKDTDRLSTFTRWAIIAPFGFVLLGMIVGIGMPHRTSDWFGGAVLVPLCVGTIVGAITAIVFSIVAFLKREPAALFSLITALPACVFVFLVARIWMRLAAGQSP
jgi:hypothetical protein